MSPVSKSLFGVLVSLCFVSVAQAQQADVSSESSASNSFPRLVRFSGTLPERRGASPAAAASARVTFAIYEEQAGGAALWSEVQDIRHDAQGRYSVLLGAASSDGLPAELFSTAGARWLGVQIEGRQEESRILLVAVPYALKAADADTLGGKPATAFVASEQLKDQVRTEVKAQATDSASTTRTLIGTAPTPQVIAETSPATFTCATSGVCVQTSQSGAGGIALRGTTGSATGTAGIFDNLGGGKILSGRTTGYAEKFYVDGSGNVWTGGALLANSYAGTSGAAVFGVVTATSGSAYGVRGQSASPSGTGVFGYATSPTGLTYGLLGANLSASGTGLSGSASSPTGVTIGVRAVSQSPNGTAAIFDNLGGGKLISARTTGYVEKFSVSGAGNVVASGSMTASSFNGMASDLNCAGCVAASELAADAGTQAELDAEASARVAADTTLQTNIDGKVSKSGDTMTGTLNLPANGLIAGGSQLVLASGRVGVGTVSPVAQLQVTGTDAPDSAEVGVPGTSAISAILAVGGNGGDALEATAGDGGSITLVSGRGGAGADGDGGFGASLVVGGGTGQDNGGPGGPFGRGGSITLTPGAGVDNLPGDVLLAPTGSGKVGIGTIAPDTRLVVAGDGTGAARIGGPGCGAGYTGISLNGQAFGSCANYNFLSSPANTSLFVNRPSTSSIFFRENNTDQVTILAGGNVGIGTVSPAHALDVVGDIYTSGCVSYSGGSVGACASDLRLKTDIELFPRALDKLVQLRPVHFNWKASNPPEYRFGSERNAGLIAQEVQQVFPEMVTTDINGYRRVNYGELPLLTLEAVRELKAENDGLKAEVGRLSEQLSALAARLSELERARQ